MTWNELFDREHQPTPSEIAAYIGQPLWNALTAFVEETYLVQPLIEHSRCTMDPGWNVKYKKGSKSICSLYPRAGYFTCMVVVRERDAVEAEFTLSTCTPYVQELYRAAKPLNGGRWLVIDVTAEDILEDVKALMLLRVKPPKK